MAQGGSRSDRLDTDTKVTMLFNLVLHGVKNKMEKWEKNVK